MAYEQVPVIVVEVPIKLTVRTKDPARAELLAQSLLDDLQNDVESGPDGEDEVIGFSFDLKDAKTYREFINR